MTNPKLIFCLEAVPDVETTTTTAVVPHLEQLALQQGLTSIYKTCDSIEGLEESLSTLLYDDPDFKNFEIIYFVLQGADNNICIDDYYYSLEEIAECFEGKLTGKILHFANTKTLELTAEEAQYFLDVTGARAISGYGVTNESLSSILLDRAFFGLCQEQEEITEVVEELHQRHFALCKRLDFRLYY
jgi:hypothetical protein